MTIPLDQYSRGRRALAFPDAERLDGLVQTWMPPSGAVTLPASRPMVVSGEPMICAAESRALLRLSPGKLKCPSPRSLPLALPANITGHSVLVWVLPHAVSDVTY